MRKVVDMRKPKIDMHKPWILVKVAVRNFVAPDRTNIGPV